MTTKKQWIERMQRFAVVPCPKCGAAAGSFCMNLVTSDKPGKAASHPHSDRLSAWARWKAEQENKTPLW